MHIDLNPKLDFRDVLIRPKRSVLSSRFEANINRTLGFRHSRREWTGFPLIASNMDTIGTIEMAEAFRPFGALVALHKFYDPERLASYLDKYEDPNVFLTVGTGAADKAQIGFMIARLLPTAGKTTADCADALAVAITHANLRVANRRVA